MNKHNHKQNKPRLSAEERAELRYSFMQHMDAHPLSTPSRWSIPSPYVRELFRAPAFAFALAVLVLGGTTYASEQALPDDFFYPVKTTVIEPVFITGLAWTAQQRATASATLITRRFEEANELASENRLDDKNAAYLANSIINEAREGTEAVEELQDTGKTLAALTLGTEIETALEAYRDVLHVITESKENDALATAFVDSFEGRIDKIEEVNDDIEEELDRENTQSETYVSATIEDIEKSIRKAHKALDGREPSSSLIVESLDRLDGAEQAYARALVDRDEGDIEGALPQLRYALQAADKALVLIESYKELEEE